SGTAYGTVVLHVSPEAAAGGTLALVKTGDLIELDVAARRLHLAVPEEELSRRRSAWRPPQLPMERGYYRLYVEHVLQAHGVADQGLGIVDALALVLDDACALGNRPQGEHAAPVDRRAAHGEAPARFR